MELKALGYSEVKSGQLLTFYLTDDEVDNKFEYVVLYALKDFNLSHLMAQYYPSMLQKIPRIKSEEVIHDFASRLAAEGYVTKPDCALVNLGNVGRPPERILKEYKYELNPGAFTLERLREEITIRSLSFFNHQGHYLLLLNPIAVGDELLLELSQAGEHLGLLHLGVVSSATRSTLLNAADYDTIKEAVGALIEEVFPDQGIVIERVLADLQPNTRFRTEPRSVCEMRYQA